MSMVLIVEDVEAMRKQYAYDLARLGTHDTREAESVDAALGVLNGEVVDCVILDLEMPGRDGFELLRELAGRESAPPVIVYTGTGDYQRCVRAVKLGAYGFVDKAEPMERVLHEIDRALERGRLQGEVRRLRGRLEEDSSLVGVSAPLRALQERIAKLAGIPSPVLILGESGTGKELVARDLHRLARGEAPFLAVNCASLPENLVESELFGHERGAFTGADRVRRGAFESAGAGTLFLDEVGDLPSPAQAKLLRVLEQETVRRVGGDREIRVACRVVAATHRDLEASVREGGFREDLLYRLNVHLLEVPPLRERRDDIPALIEHFLSATARRFGESPRSMAPEAVELLRRFDWRRNNVRELRNTVERLVLAAGGSEIGADAVPAVAGGGGGDAEEQGTFQELRRAAERQILQAALARNDGHLTRTAEELGLADHASLSKMLTRLGLRGE